MEISLTFSKDRDILKRAFLNSIDALQENNLKTLFNEKEEGNEFTFSFALKEITDDWFLLPLSLAKTLTFYTTDYREEDYLEEILQKNYCFLDEDTKEKTRAQLKICKSDTFCLEQRQMLLFFPIINYFSTKLPNFSWHYDGFLLFRSRSYWAALDAMIATAAEDAILTQPQRATLLHYPSPSHQDKKKSPPKKV